MLLFLTGASSSVTKSEDVAQTDISKSLGGYISSTQVPNNAINSLFDLISIHTIKDKPKETVAIGLVNKFDYAVKDVSLKLISDQDNICKFRVAAVMADENLCFEHINNRYAEPSGAEFYDACFYRASVDVEIKKPAIAGESISIEPFNVVADVETAGIEGTWNAINKAFSNSNQYSVKRLTETSFRVESKDENVINEPVTCSYLSTDEAELEFDGKYENKENTELLLTERLEPNGGIGIWLQRQIDESKVEVTDEELVEAYDSKKKIETTEKIELVINYEIDESTSTSNCDCNIDGGGADAVYSDNTCNCNIDGGKNTITEN